MVRYICEKFHENISNGFQFTEQDKYMVEMAMFSAQRAITPKVGKPEGVHEFCMSSYEALNLPEVSSKYLRQFPTYRADTSTW